MTDRGGYEDARRFWVTFSGEAEITVSDDRVILRVTENRDADDRAWGDPEWQEATSYRNTLYRIDSTEDVLEMLLWNAAANGVRQANRLDGWADLPADAAEVRIDSVSLENVAETSADDSP